MNKKVLLAVLPAVMVLTSCGMRPAANNKVFLEDTLAHEELFGGSNINFNLMRADEEPSREARTVSAPDIGYQIQYNSSTDKLAIRFVAAVKELSVKAYWRRGVAGADGSELSNKSFANPTQEATKYYLQLTDGNTTIEIGKGKYADYAGFVVYTLRDIPYSDNSNAYVAAYLNLVDSEDGDIHNNSKGLAVKIEKKNNYESANAFAFDPTVSGHFLEGTINNTLFDGGTNGLYRESDPSRKNDTDFAWYENVSLKTTDSFGSFYYDHDRIFQYFGANPYFKESAGFFEKASQAGFVKPILEGTYEMHISSGNGNHVYTDAKSYAGSLTSYTKLYLISGEWNKDGAWFNAHFFGGADADLSMTAVEGISGAFEVAIPSGATKVTICRMGPNAGDSGLNWYINDRPVWNKTDDLTLADRFNDAGPLGACTITAAGDCHQEWVGGVSNIMK